MGALKRILKYVLVFSLIIGIVGITISKLFEIDATFLHTYYTETGLKYYRYDFVKYYNAIKNTIITPAELELQLPEKVWRTDIDLVNWPEILTNNLAVMGNSLIIVGNIALYPVKVGAWILRFIWTLIGLDFFTGAPQLQWLVDMINGGIQLSIPYIE